MQFGILGFHAAAMIMLG